MMASSLLAVAAALLCSTLSILVLGGLLVFTDASAEITEFLLLFVILPLALGQPHVVGKLAGRLGLKGTSTRVVAIGTLASSMALMVLGVLVSRTW